MRALVLVPLVLGGCINSALISTLSELPAEPQKRDAVLDSSSSKAGPEHRKGMSSRMRKAETAAATAAAIAGLAFSKSANVRIGVGIAADQPSATKPVTRPPAPADADRSKEASEALSIQRDTTDLVPWVRLK